MVRSSVKTSEAIEFGPKGVEFVPFSSINELPQVRTSYAADAIDELARAIQSEQSDLTVVSTPSSDDFELANPLLMGRHTRASAKSYIKEHGDYYRIPQKERIDPQDLTPLEDDTALILIAGHRRRRAISHLLNNYGIQPLRVRVASNIHEDVSFGHAIGLQLRENVYERPSPEDEARAIDLAYRYAQETTGRIPSKASLARQLGFSETKVRDALEFASLPDEIQAYTTSGILSYSVTRQLKPLFDVFLQYHSQLPATERAQAATDSLREFCDSQVTKQLSNKSVEAVTKAISTKIRAVEDEIRWAGQQSFEFDDIEFQQTPRARRDRAGRVLANTALAVLRYRSQGPGLRDDEVEQLEALLAAYRQAKRAEPEMLELPLTALNALDN